MNPTPASLLEQLRQPARPDAWRRFVSLYTPLLSHWARRLGLQDADAADLLQDVFTALYRSLPAFAYDPRKSFRAYLRTVLVNKWREYRRRGTLPQAAADLDALEDPAAAIEEAEYRRHLMRRALQIMQTDFQPLTWRACWEQVVGGRAAAEVAEELGISVASAYAARSRVLRRLRSELEGLLD